MDIISFEIPVLGSYYVMYSDFIRFRFKEDQLIFQSKDKLYDNVASSVATTILFLTRKNHHEIIHYLHNTDNPSIVIKKMNRYKYNVVMEKTFENMNFMIRMLHTLFPNEKISMDVMCDDKYPFGRCDHHLLDLYEMGYMSLVSADFKDNFYEQHKTTRIFTGILLIARNPFQKYNYDFIELKMFCNCKHEFLRLSFDMFLQDCSHMIPNLTFIIRKMVESLPLRQEDIKRIMNVWNKYHDMEIRTTDLTVPIVEWNPIHFLQTISRLLDMFPNYYINPKFNLDINVHP